MSLRSISSYLTAPGFTPKITHHKTAEYKVTSSALCRIAIKWLKNTPLHATRASLCSLDYVVTGHRTDRREHGLQLARFNPSRKPVPPASHTASSHAFRLMERIVPKQRSILTLRDFAATVMLQHSDGRKWNIRIRVRFLQHYCPRGGVCW
jgi:hypothetical protein